MQFTFYKEKRVENPKKCSIIGTLNCYDELVDKKKG